VGGAARVFTIMNEVKDFGALAPVLIGTILNGIIVSQFFLYKMPSGTRTIEGSRKKQQ